MRKRDSKVASWVPGSGKTKAYYKRLARKQERAAGKQERRDA